MTFIEAINVLQIIDEANSPMINYLLDIIQIYYGHIIEIHDQLKQKSYLINYGNHIFDNTVNLVISQSKNSKRLIISEDNIPLDIKECAIHPFKASLSIELLAHNDLVVNYDFFDLNHFNRAAQRIKYQISLENQDKVNVIKTDIESGAQEVNQFCISSGFVRKR